MEHDKLETLLGRLAERSAEQVRPGLAGDIKEQIPAKLMHHRKGMDTVNIVIDLRVGKVAAAAAIIITMLLLANMHGIYEDGRLLAQYLLGGAEESNISTGKVRYEHLVGRGEDVVFYENVDPEDSEAVRMYWKLADGKYKVIFVDYREKEVSAEELVKLQARMLQRKGR